MNRPSVRRPEPGGQRVFESPAGAVADAPRAGSSHRSVQVASMRSIRSAQGPAWRLPGLPRLSSSGRAACCRVYVRCGPLAVTGLPRSQIQDRQHVRATRVLEVDLPAFLAHRDADVARIIVAHARLGYLLDEPGRRRFLQRTLGSICLRCLRLFQCRAVTPNARPIALPKIADQRFVLRRSQGFLKNILQYRPVRAQPRHELLRLAALFFQPS